MGANRQLDYGLADHIVVLEFGRKSFVNRWRCVAAVASAIES